MTTLKEHFERTRSNFDFQTNWRNAIKTAIQSRIPTEQPLRMLDYGAGMYTNLFLLRPNQEIIAYDPFITDSKYDSLIRLSRTPETPTGNFDIVICHFSLHHLTEDPAYVI